MSSRSFKHQFISGASITFISKYSNVFINILTGAILARILEPEEFGVVAVVIVFTTFFRMMGQMGLGAAVIQHKDLSENDISDIFKFTFLLSIVFAVLFYFFSYAIAFFYTNTIYIHVGQLLSISVLFNSLNVVPNAILLRNKNFKAIGVTSILTNVITGILAIVLALNGLSYFSIVIKSIILSILTFLIFFIICNIKIRKNFSLRTLRIIGSYSAYEFLHSIINYFSRNLDNILIGKFLGPVQLGYYDKAYKLMLYPVQNLTHVITPVLHPLLSDYQHNTTRIYLTYKRLTKFLMMTGVPICSIMFFYAKEIITILYGEKWLYIIPTFKILAMSIILQIITGTGGAIFRAAGKTHTLFITGLISSILLVSGISIGVFYGKLEYVASAILISMSVNFFQMFFFLIVKVLKKSLMDFCSNFINPILTGVILIGINLLFSKTTHIESNIINLLLGLLVTGATWLACIFVLKESQFMGINNIFNKLTTMLKPLKNNRT